MKKSVNPKVTIINNIDLEKHLANSWGDDQYRRESDGKSIQAGWDRWTREIEDHFKNFSVKVSIEISGHPILFKIRIAQCVWYLRPLLWFKLKQFLRRKKGEITEIEKQYRNP